MTHVRGALAVSKPRIGDGRWLFIIGSVILAVGTFARWPLPAGARARGRLPSLPYHLAASSWAWVS